jgi:hypothetical protein
MDPAHQAMIAQIDSDRAANALSQIERSQEQHSMRWKCKACRYTKHFTRPVPLVNVLG